ncbi:MAG: hypothetical protein Q8R24_02415 [Legionellaceae bacterium]|nr:hypothetical protein [Legionellaceae bacterium]
MSFDAFMAALQNPTVHNEQLTSIFINAVKEEQTRIVEALPSIVIKMVDNEDSVRLMEVLRTFLPGDNRIRYAYPGDQSDLYWKEFVIANLLHNSVTHYHFFNASPKFEPLESTADYKLLFGSFEKIIDYILRNHAIDLNQIKNEYGSFLLTAIIRRYPALFDLVIELGAQVNGSNPTKQITNSSNSFQLFPGEPHNSNVRRSRRLTTLSSVWMEQFNKFSGQIIHERIHSSPYRKSYITIENNRIRFFGPSSMPVELESMAMYVETARLYPLTASIIEMSCDPLNDQLNAIVGVLFNHPDINFNLCEYQPVEIAIHLNILDDVKRAALSPKMRSLENQFITDTLFNKNHEVSFSPYAYGLLHEPVPGDGHCLYHAVALRTNRTVNNLRHAVADYIENGHLNCFLTESNTQQSYARGVREGQWGDQIEITALMHILRRPIVVFHEAGTPPTKPHQTDNFPGDPIFIYYNGTDHYTGLLPNAETEARYILNVMLPLVERIRELPSELTMNVFSFLSPSERLALVRNTRFDEAARALEMSIFRPINKRKKPDDDMESDMDTASSLAKPRSGMNS